MSDALLAALLPAIDIAAFRRGADGSFSPMAPPPPWFPRLADATFPFLGHILDEASEFWRSGASGSREFGPCAETDASGREFHYRVRAVTIPASGIQFLIFELDPGSDRLRDALQKGREQTLDLEQARARRRQAAGEIRRAGEEILRLLEQLSAAAPTGAPANLINALRAQCDALVGRATTIAD